MSDTTQFAASFTGLVDLAAAELGGRAIAASDEFFAGKENLLLPGRGVFIEGKFTDRGKWMDGWESRRKRGPGYDWCVIELGAVGQVVGFDIDTHHFIGNHPPFASVEGAWIGPEVTVEAITRAAWHELLQQVPLRPGSQNLFAASIENASHPVSHVRLNIFPDGGVARFRAFGRVQADQVYAREPLDAESRARVMPGWIDLAAVKNGGLALACSDAFFGPMNNLLLPGSADNMGGGWETRRKRAPGHDWILIRLAKRGTPGLVEVDTNHFKGNYPDRCSIDGIEAPDARITELIASRDWRPIVAETKLHAHQRHFFEPLPNTFAVTHVRLNIYPDGGVSRLRVWGAS